MTETPRRPEREFAVAAVVLAAGASRRMGRAKALVHWRGRPFSSWTIDLARAAHCHPIVLVEGAHVLPPPSWAGARRVRHPGWAAGPLSSLQAGLRALDAVSNAHVLVLTVDRPHLRPATVVQLVEAARESPRGIWQPSFSQRHGHPMIWPADLRPDLLKLPPTGSPRDLLGRPDVALRRRFLSVDDPAVLDNLDTPRDLARLPP